QWGWSCSSPLKTCRRGADRSAPASGAGAPFDANHTLHALDRLDDLLEVFDVADLDGHVDPRLLILAGPRFHVGDVGVDVRYLRADLGEHAFAIFHLHREAHDIRRLIGTGAVPFDLDAPLG